MKQLTIVHEPGTVLSGPWKRRALAERSAEVFTLRGIPVEIEERDGRFVVVEA